ncbi:MAG: hypothetical protein ACI81T_002973 [Bacteroidia bacterium]
MGDNPDNKRNSYSLSWYFSQVASKRFEWSISSDVVYQQGFLSTPFHRVYFANEPANQSNVEVLPDNRFKLPVGVRANCFLGYIAIIKSYYRYYWDWGLIAHAASVEIPVKITPFLSVYPFYRYYTQTEVDYFAPYQAHSNREEFYTSDYDLSAFDSHFYGIGMRYALVGGLWTFKNIISKKQRMLNAIELRYGMYNRSNGLDSNIISVHFKFKGKWLFKNKMIGIA